MTPGAEVGNILRVIAGTGRGQLRKITGNTATQLSWDLPLALDQTSVWIVEATNDSSFACVCLAVAPLIIGRPM